MKAPAPKLSVLVLTEDGAGDAHACIVALLKKAFLLLVPACRTHLVAFEPANDNARRYVVGNAWKGDGPPGRAGDRFRLVELHRTIATTLLEDSPPGFVVFHFDGDRRWSERATSENVAKFARRVVDPVRKLLTSHRPAEVAEAALSRLRMLTPFYSVEAWLYQNLYEARRICGELGSPPALIEQLAAWEADRASLDDLTQPKIACSLGAVHNLRLAIRAWPAHEVYAIERSFAAAVEGLLECDALLVALEATVAA